MPNNKVRIRRVELGMKQFKVAGKVGITSSTLSLIEAGRYNANKKLRNKLAKVLRCKSVTEIFPRE